MAVHALHAESKERWAFERLTTEGQPEWANLGLETLYRQYAPALREFCRSRLGDPDAAEDACHDALLKAYGALPRFRPGPVWPWLATIAANVCLDVQRGRVKVVPSDGQNLDEPSLTLEEEARSRVRARIVGDALMAMPQHYRSYIYMRDFDGWSWEQIAEFHGASVASVRSTLMRARRALKLQIKRIARREGQWPLPAFVPGAWIRLRAALDDFKSSVRDLVAGPCSRLTAGSWESLNVLAPTLVNIAAAAIMIATMVGESSSSAELPTEEPPMVLAAFSSPEVTQPVTTEAEESKPVVTASTTPIQSDTNW